MPLLEAFKNSLEYNRDFPTDKVKLCELINELSPLMYVLNQNRWRYNGLQDSGPLLENEAFKHTKKYLSKVTPDRILINEEVDQYNKEVDWDNGETFILDMTLHNNNIYCK